MSVTIGSNDFFGVPFPLVLADRFFNIYRKGERLGLNVFRWDPDAKDAVFEVVDGVPLVDNITTNPTGIVTFTHADDDSFMYKFRPKPGVSQIFGKVPVNEELEVRINDHQIEVLRLGSVMCTLARNQFSGFAIGMQLGADGSLAIGVGALPEGLEVLRAS